MKGSARLKSVPVSLPLYGGPEFRGECNGGYLSHCWEHKFVCFRRNLEVLGIPKLRAELTTKEIVPQSRKVSKCFNRRTGRPVQEV